MADGALHRDGLAFLFYSDFRQDDWWTFEMFLQGPEESLDTVEEVAYILPPSFTPAVRRVRDRASQFRLEGSTSGPFQFHVNVRYRDGSESSSAHILTLTRNVSLGGLIPLHARVADAGLPRFALPGPMQFSRGERPPLAFTNGAAWVVNQPGFPALPASAKGDYWIAVRFEREGAPGFAPGTISVLTTYRLFPDGSLLDALTECLAQLVLPERIEDLSALPPGAIVTIEGQGSLDFQARVEVGFEPNVLHSLSDAPSASRVELRDPSGSLAVRWRISTPYSMQIDRSGLGVSISFVLQSGPGTVVSASILDRASLLDLFDGFLGRQPDREQSRLALEFALARRLELALTAQLTGVEENAPVFACNFDLQDLTEIEQRAVEKSLSGDLSLAADPNAWLPHLHVSRNTLAAVCAAPHKIDTTVLAAVSDAITPRVAFTPGTGELLVAGAARPAKPDDTTYYGIPEETLVKKIDEDFLTSAAIRSSQAQSGLPNLRQRYFASHPHARISELLLYLRVGQALEIVSPNETPVIEQSQDQGRLDVRIELTFDQQSIPSLFFGPAGDPRDLQDYETIGRRAMRLLIQPGAPDAFRLRPLVDDVLWQQLKELGIPNFQRLIGTALQAAVITADYYTIMWWANSMSSISRILAALRTCAEERRQIEFRKQFSRALERTRKTWREDFGNPWGLVATYFAAGRRPRAAMEIIGRRFTLITTAREPVSV